MLTQPLSCFPSWHSRIYTLVIVKSEYASHTQFDPITMAEYVFVSCFMYDWFDNASYQTLYWWVEGLIYVSHVTVRPQMDGI